MATVRKPRAGSMQYWPRKRAKRAYARIRHSPQKEKGLVAFAGYKVGMTHILAIETSKFSHRKGEEISIPVTIVECPPIKIASVRFYKKEGSALKLKKEIFTHKNEKELAKKIHLPKKHSEHSLDKIKPEEYDTLRVTVFTQPKLTNLGKKKPELFEMSLGGEIADKFHYVKEHIEKDIYLETVFKEGEIVDLKAVTKGKGFQGPIKRFGISLRQSKSEKSIRNPGSLGPWKGQGHIMYRVAHAGKMGFHQRTEFNKQIMKIISNPKEITPKGGIVKYGILKNPCVLVKGSVGGAAKRMIILQKAARSKPKELPTIQEINVSEKQGN